MPKITDVHHTPKILFMSDSGFGKTGALASLANAGWNLWIKDFDNGTQILNQYLTDEGRQRVHVRTYTDAMESDGLSIRPKDGVPTAYADFVSDLRGFDEDGTSYPSVDSLERKDILVVDSLTMLSQSAMRYRLALNIGAGGDPMRWMHPYPQDYGEAQDLIRKVLELLYSAQIKCGVVVNTHIKYVGGGGTQTITDNKTGTITRKEVDSSTEGVAFPTAIGRALGPEILRYFNTVVSGEMEGSGLSSQRFVVTRDLARFPLKSERPIDLEERLPIDSALATIFKVLGGKSPEDLNIGEENA